jgi:hypothetical protein
VEKLRLKLLLVELLDAWHTNSRTSLSVEFALLDATMVEMLLTIWHDVVLCGNIKDVHIVNVTLFIH